jgi:hypothetical protein
LEARDIVPYRGQIVDIDFADRARVRAHIVSVDVNAFDNHVFYKMLQDLDPTGSGPRSAKIGEFLTGTAGDITRLTPTDGKHYDLVVPARPWWKFW